MSRRGGRRFRKDVAPNGFFFNCRTDHRLLAGVEGPNELKDVKRGEAVVYYTPKSKGRYRDTLTHAASVYVEDRPWRFIGVANTHCDWDRHPQHAFADRGFVVQAGGVVTVMNESDKKIQPGDMIRLIPPKVNHECKETGIPKNKQRFVFEPVHMPFYDKDSICGKALSEAFSGEKFDLLLTGMFT